MKCLTLIDSSSWIATIRPKSNLVTAATVTELLREGKAAMTEPVWLELYQGIRGKAEEARLEISRELCHWLPFDSLCWEEAARTARICQRSGVNVPFGDILVHACARRYKVELLENDKHFVMIRKASAKK